VITPIIFYHANSSRPFIPLSDSMIVFWISSKCGVSFLSHVGLVEAQINLFKLVIAVYRTFDPKSDKRVVRDF
jgi:hypothetical protein